MIEFLIRRNHEICRCSMSVQPPGVVSAARAFKVGNLLLKYYDEHHYRFRLLKTS